MESVANRPLEPDLPPGETPPAGAPPSQLPTSPPPAAAGPPSPPPAGAPPAQAFVEIDGERIPVDDVRTARALRQWFAANPGREQELIAWSSGQAQLVANDRLSQLTQPPAPAGSPTPPAQPPAGGPPQRPPAAPEPDEDDPVAREVAQLRSTVQTLSTDMGRIRTTAARQVAIEGSQAFATRHGLNEEQRADLLRFAGEKGFIGQSRRDGLDMRPALEQALDWAFRIRYPERVGAPATTRQTAHQMLAGSGNGNGNGHYVPEATAKSFDDALANFRKDIAAEMGMPEQP